MPCLHWAAPPPSPCPNSRPHNCPHNCPHARPHTSHGAFAQKSARFHPRYAHARAHDTIRRQHAMRGHKTDDVVGEYRDRWSPARDSNPTRPLPGQSEQQPTNAHLVDLAAGGCRPDHRRTWGEKVRNFVKRTGTRVRALVRAFVRAIVRAHVRAGRGRWGGPMQAWPLGYWAWPATFHIGRRGAAALAHLLQRPVWPMQQPPSNASRFGCSARAWA